MNKEIQQMLDDLRELEDAKDAAEVERIFGKINGKTGELVGIMEAASDNQMLIYPELKKIVDNSYEDVKKGNKSAIYYANTAGTMLEKVKKRANETHEASTKAVQIYKKASKIRERKLQEFKIST